MSGIYIPGMEMPKSCFYCPMRIKVDPDNIKCLVTGERFEETFAGTIEMRNRGNCPIVPVPPHRDLIERDVLKELLKIRCIEDNWVYASVAEMPTIIPADGKEGE